MAANPGETYAQLQQALADADAQAAAALYAPDGVYYDADNQAYRGQDRIRDYLKGRFATRGPVQFTVKRQVADGNSVVLAEWTSASKEDGRSFTGLPGTTVIEVGGSGITYHRDYQ